MPVGDRVKTIVPAPPVGVGDVGIWQRRVEAFMARVRDQVEAVVQRLEAQAAPPDDAKLGVGQIWFYLDEAGNNLKVRVRYSTGVYKTGTVALV